MTDEADEPGRPPAHDLAAFDLGKRSPEQLAQSFAQWKARRRPPQASGAAAAAPKPPPASAQRAEKPAAPASRAAAPKRGWAKRSIPVQYSDTFSSLLAAGSEPPMQRSEPAPIVVARPSPQRRVLPGRRLRAMTVLAGAASLVTLAGGALLELSSWRAAEPKSAQIRPAAEEIVPIARAATNVHTVAWARQPMIDRALLRAVAPPAMQTASKAATPSAKPAPSQPTFKKAAPETAQFVAKPFIRNAAPLPPPALTAPARAAIQTAPLATAIHTGDPRPDALFQHRRGQGDGAFSGRVASGSKSAAAPKSNSAAQAPAGSGDPRGEVNGGARAATGAGSEMDADAGGETATGAAASDGGSAPSDGNDGGAEANTRGSDSDGTDSGGSDAGDGADGSADAGAADAASSGAAAGESSPENADTDQGN